MAAMVELVPYEVERDKSYHCHRCTRTFTVSERHPLAFMGLHYKGVLLFCGSECFTAWSTQITVLPAAIRDTILHHYRRGQADDSTEGVGVRVPPLGGDR